MTNALQGDPRLIYQGLHEDRRREADALRTREARLANLRLLAFLATLVLIGLAFVWGGIARSWVALPAAGFGALLFVHDRVIGARERLDRAVAFYEDGLARLDGTWPGRGEAGERHRDPDHLYADDLDLFGSGSVFELVCRARTRAGQDRLARWLLEPSAPDAVRARQQAAAELGRSIPLREDLALLGDELEAGLHPDALKAWSEAPPRLPDRRWRWAVGALAATSVLTLVAWLAGMIGPAPFVAALAVQLVVAALLRERVIQVVRAADLPARDLALLAELLGRIEGERFESALLVALRGSLETGGDPPSRRTAALRMRVDLLDARRNQLFAPFGALVLWTTQLAFAIEHWRSACGAALVHWLDAVGELEALVSIGAFHFENPDAVFPELEDAAEVCFDAEGVGHPLLPAGACVRNDVRLDAAHALLLVSGSNMSGKSTLLRTVGVSAVLAQAGAPVRARRLRMTPLCVAASIRVQDSLQQGRSRFYAEIRRLRAIMDRAGGSPALLFLVDEMLQGTNSRDRAIGAEAVIRGLLERGAVGLVTTHDLALARVADELAPRASNVHFQDHLEGGEIAFDYRMRPGVAEKSNALELMRAVGLTT
jgi:hypothetical protein